MFMCGLWLTVGIVLCENIEVFITVVGFIIVLFLKIKTMNLDGYFFVTAPVIILFSHV